MSVNKWIGIGNLTREVELKYTPSGAAVCNFSIACNESYKDRDGNKQESVEYVNIVIWRQLAEIAGKYLEKGKQVYIEGKLKTRKWQDREGNDKYTTEIVADQMQMLGSKSDGEQRPAQQAYQPAAPQRPAYKPQDKPAFNPDESIPF